MGSDASDKAKAVEMKSVFNGKEDDVVAKVQTKEEKKAEAAKNKKNVSRVWNMHEGDKFYFFVGCVGAFLVGGANPAVGVILVKCIKTLFLTDPDEVRADAITW